MMAIRFDTHMHSSFSTDSGSPMEDMVSRAASAGLDGICFTEHMDLDYPPFYFPDDPQAFVSEPQKIYEKIEALRASDTSKTCFSGIQIGFGLEFGMQEHLADRFHSIAEQYPLDFIIASQHLVSSLDPYYPEAWDGKSTDEMIGRYYEEMLGNLKSMKDWDTLAHLDYIIRYIPGKKSQVYDSLSHHKQIIDEILLYVIQSGKCLEVNSAGFKYGLGQPHPAPSILRRYRELGGYRITIGSDAHAPEHIGIGFSELEKLLRPMGFCSYTVFFKRIPREIPF